MENSDKKRKLLGVNIDHVATLRQARGTAYPSVLEAAEMAVRGGADQITVHLREDRRHIQDRDVYELKGLISVPLNLEMAAEGEIIRIAKDSRPHRATLVPEKREELTTEGGLDCVAGRTKLAVVINELKSSGIEVSLFINPETRQIVMAKELGADAIELHTGTYCDSRGEKAKQDELNRLSAAAALAKSLDIKVAAGHGLSYDNIGRVVEFMPEILEYNIGHSVVARAVFTGIENAVREMVDLLV